MTTTGLPFALPKRLSQSYWYGLLGSGFMVWIAVESWDRRSEELGIFVMVAAWILIAPSALRPAHLEHDGFRAGWLRRHVPFSEIATFAFTRWWSTGTATLHSGKKISLSFAGLHGAQRDAALRWIDLQIEANVFA